MLHFIIKGLVIWVTASVVFGILWAMTYWDAHHPDDWSD